MKKVYLWRSSEARSKFLKGNGEQSPKYRYGILELVDDIQRSIRLYTVSIAMIAISFYLRRADVLAAVGAVIAVAGILRFRKGYVERLSKESGALESTLPDGADDHEAATGIIGMILSGAESNGVKLAVLGTLVNGFSGLVGHLIGWHN